MARVVAGHRRRLDVTAGLSPGKRNRTDGVSRVLLAPAACRSGLEKAPLQDASLELPEILMSEPRERMMAVVEPEHVDEFLAVCARWDVRAAPLSPA